MKRILTLMLVLLLVLTAMIACKKPEEPKHEPTKTAQVDATCTADGVKAYWYCPTCQAYYTDDTCTNKIDNIDTWKAGDGKIAAVAHTAVKTEQVDATATADGVKAYWTCSVCKANFSDEACTAKIENLDAWKTGDGKIPAEGPAPENKGTLKPAVYNSAFSVAMGEMSMNFNITLTLKADGTFTMIDATGADKGNGTWALTGDCYTLTFAADKTTTFVVDNAESTALTITSHLYYGANGFDPASVDGGKIVFSFSQEIPAPHTHSAVKTEQVNATATTDGVKAYWYCAGCTTYFSDEACTAQIENLDAWKTGDGKIPATGAPEVTYTLAAGTYVGTYEKTIVAMNMTVTYHYNATFNADGTFNYFVKYIMMGSVQDGVNISGTYTVAGNTVTLTPAEGTAIAGTLTADNTLAIALQATGMSTEAYEITFTAGDHVIPEVPVDPPVDPEPEVGGDDIVEDGFADPIEI